MQFCGILIKNVVVRADIRLKNWRWSSYASNWTFKGPKHPHKVKFKKFSFENHDPLRIFSDMCVTLKNWWDALRLHLTLKFTLLNAHFFLISATFSLSFPFTCTPLPSNNHRKLNKILWKTGKNKVLRNTKKPLRFREFSGCSVFAPKMVLKGPKLG